MVGRIGQQAVPVPQLDKLLIDHMSCHVTLVSVQGVIIATEEGTHPTEVRRASQGEVGHEQVP